MKTTSIKYLLDSQNSLEYTDKNGETHVLNPFSPDYGPVATRFSVIMETNSLNMKKRKNYEDAVANAQISEDNGRPYDPLPEVPTCDFFPDDPTEPGHVIAWEPPLATLKPGKKAVSTVHGLVNSTLEPAAQLTLDPAAVFLERLLSLLLDHAPQLAEMGLTIAKKS